jgi:hypothetical protein
MDFQPRTFKIIFLLGFFVILAGCSGSDSAEPIPTHTADPNSLSAQPFEFTFDGATCTASGPAELPPGEHLFILYNTSDLIVTLEPVRLWQGKTLQDLLDIQKEPGVWFPKPSWAEHTSARGAAWSSDDGGRVWAYKLYISGEHIIQVIIFDSGNDPNENQLWYCQQFTVKVSPSE